MRTLACVVTCALLVLGSPIAEAQQDPFDTHLSVYEGEWTTAALATGPNGEAVELQGTATGKRMLSPFVQQTVQFRNQRFYPGEGFAWIMTSDQRGYRAWLYHIDGTVSEGEAHFDFETSLLTARLKDGKGRTMSLEYDTTNRQQQKWSLSITSPEGKLVSTLTGTNTKKSDPAR